VRRLVVMAQRLFGFMTVMAAFALLFGLWLWLGFHDSGRWLMLKLVFVAGLVAYHLACRVLLRRLQQARPLPSSLALRLFNEAALLLVVPIILLAVVKPF
jgi:putative membrane protein